MLTGSGTHSMVVCLIGRSTSPTGGSSAGSVIIKLSHRLSLRPLCVCWLTAACRVYIVNTLHATQVLTQLVVCILPSPAPAADSSLYSVFVIFSSAVNCSDPGTPTNGQRSLSSTTYNSVVSFTCDVGHTLQGPNSRTCQSNGQWSRSVPQCDRMFENGVVVLK